MLIASRLSYSIKSSTEILHSCAFMGESGSSWKLMSKKVMSEVIVMVVLWNLLEQLPDLTFCEFPQAFPEKRDIPICSTFDCVIVTPQDCVQLPR